MLLVPGDYFVMGVSADVLAEECSRFGRDCDPLLFAPVQPQHPVRLDSFYVDAYEVSNEAFVDFLDAQGRRFGACGDHPCIFLEGSRIGREGNGQYVVEPGFADHPVHSVTWYGAAAFCDWRGTRLPTEAEWEMAASWEATHNEKRLYPWGNRFDGAVVNFCDASCNQLQANGAYDDGYAETAPAGSYPGGRSAVGAYDMGGNVWEWVADWFSPRYYSHSPQENPQGPAAGQARVLRGGSWFDTGNFTATVFRTGLPPHRSNDSVGFRCAWGVGD